ncbi:MAG: M23 family metallopeptidase [Gammaproteobacteria bacterium]|nr:M23 family metallopeptidase [Gammaproteobacteria bacterium]
MPEIAINTRQSVIMVLAILGLWPDVGTGATRCDDNLICITEQKKDAAVELLATNRAAFPVSLSISARLRNYRAEPKRSLSTVLEAGERRRIMRLEPRDEKRAGSYRYWFEASPGRLEAVHHDHYLYRLPYQAGRSYRVLQGFGSRFSHKGVNRYAVDFKMPVGTPVHAARGGIVVKVESRHDRGCWERGCGKYANYIVILHDDGTTGEYYHLRQDGAVVEPNQRVRTGQHIGYSGNTGHTTLPHLHFAVYRPRPWGEFESMPIRFRSQDGVISAPRHGGRYVAD